MKTSVEMLFDANASARSTGVGTVPVTREVIDRTIAGLDGYERARAALATSHARHVAMMQMHQTGMLDSTVNFVFDR
ncbi:MAG: hypothetical protein DRQ39_06860 [Gammaproteobacteria bacterium]|nr:MAG: hypothetical protein DRQ39_06860 [Gammaproteobacteria bacterium]